MGERAAAWAAERGHALIEVIALDGDDTLWHSEHLFVDTQDRFRDLVRPYVDLDDAGLDERLLEVERRNLPLFGYGVKAFTLSLVETAIEVTDGRIPGRRPAGGARPRQGAHRPPGRAARRCARGRRRAHRPLPGDGDHQGRPPPPGDEGRPLRARRAVLARRDRVGEGRGHLRAASSSGTASSRPPS